MQIQLKQTEIEQALRAYIVEQGINLTGRTSDITFISGRKDNGLTAEISIEDINQVKAPPFKPIQEAAPASVTVAEIHDPVPEAPIVEEPTPVKVSNLFA